MKKLFFSLLLAAALCGTYSCETEKGQLIIFGPSSNTGDSSDPSAPGTEQPDDPSDPGTEQPDDPSDPGTEQPDDPSDPGTEQPAVPSIPEPDFSVSEDLSLSGAANCYIVSSSGTYKFRAVQGNAYTSVGFVASAEVLWESFGTSTTPSVGSLISEVGYKNNYIAFSTPPTFKEGNAVIAAKDAAGTILWSWHIWLTDKPKDQVYNNNAGTMMDRNLGAISATPGNVGALGLLYQWGRKDPFLGSSSISSSIVAKSTITWPSAVVSNSFNGTIAYATAHPTTFITNDNYAYDWQYDKDDTRWQSLKTIYDPCPAGYRVPDSGDFGVWPIAFGTSRYFIGSYDSTNEGFNFGSSGGNAKKLTGNVSTCWYPAAGCLVGYVGKLSDTAGSGSYWSCTPNGDEDYALNFGRGEVFPSNLNFRSFGQSVRCLQE